MKRKLKIAVGISACILLSACAKEPENSQPVNEILKEQAYIDVQMGEAYHQSEVKLDREENRAVIPKDAAWGRPEYREENEAGIYYGEGEGGEIFDTDKETSPELYDTSYLESIQNLNLTVKDVKKADYVVQIAASSKLKLFEKELRQLTGLVMKDQYELTGVEISFDKQGRPVKKEFQLQESDEDELKKGEIDSEQYTQEFSYETNAVSFERSLKKVKKQIEQE